MSPGNSASGTATFTSTSVGQFRITPTTSSATEQLTGTSVSPSSTTAAAVQVNYYAQPAFALNNGTPGTGLSGNLTGSGASYTLTLNVPAGGGPADSLTLTNSQLDAIYQDSLAGTFDTSGVSPNLAASGWTIGSPLASGGSQGGLTLTYNGGVSGQGVMFAGKIAYAPTSGNGSGTTNLSSITINLQLESTTQNQLLSYSGSTAGPVFGTGPTYVATWSIESNAAAGSGNSYGLLESGVVGQGNGANPTGAPGSGFGPLLTTDGHGNNLYAQILAGYNSGTYTGGAAATVSMSWRNRLSPETSPQEGGTPTSPPLQYVGSYLISNVLNLSGLGTSGNSRTYGPSSANTPYFGSPSVTEHETDPFVLQMNYNVPLLSNESNQAKHGTIFIGWLAPAGFQVGGVGALLTSPEWLNAVTGDFDGSGNQNGFLGADAVAKYQGSFNAFLAAEFGAGVNSTNVTPLELNEVLGSWGVDTTNHDAWTVINHNSQFAVVPEPSSLLLAALGLLGLAGYGVRRRCRQQRNAVQA